jgi:hypothetical protein
MRKAHSESLLSMINVMINKVKLLKNKSNGVKKNGK